MNINTSRVDVVNLSEDLQMKVLLMAKLIQMEKLCSVVPRKTRNLHAEFQTTDFVTQMMCHVFDNAPITFAMGIEAKLSDKKISFSHSSDSETLIHVKTDGRILHTLVLDSVSETQAHELCRFGMIKLD